MALFHAGKDSMIEKMFIEPGDPFKVSDAETMLNSLILRQQPQCFTKVGCPFVPVPRRC